MDRADFDALYELVWPRAASPEEVRKAKWTWFRQNLAAAPDSGVIAQLSNGPCGMLAAVQAYELQQLFFPEASANISCPLGTSTYYAAAVASACSVDSDADFEDPFEASALAAAPSASVPCLRTETFESEAALAEAVGASAAALTEPGSPAVVCLLMSLLLTRGVEATAKEARLDPMLATLVYRDGCSEQALLNLCLTGRAVNDVAAQHWVDWTGSPLIGFLTDADGVHAADCFQFPTLPIFVLNSGGHYTTANSWRLDPPVFAFFHLNGLRPLHADGKATRESTFRLALFGEFAPSGRAGGKPPKGVPSPAGQQADNKARKIKRILQHRVAPGGSKEGGPFEFLVVCEANGSMEGTGADVPPYWPARWYCRDCTLKGEWGAYNAAEALELAADPNLVALGPEASTMSRRSSFAVVCSVG
ncbi:hypothetical protein FNF29_05386 [Cafeteria roenbergensis]|uniref:Deubiquitinating enzyme MINDY-3/4 conserved domain-containing protein n=1 Tax=Cafeteria roenbergensis TaxID=33653 RepID=A0A5A8CCT0_CAFRO|nr:hypothetical protein FNF29_05386 [Cafeteria roenbergensis]|eukprot:KAA0150374.1 hypothetical protein FNF29_05386 [Cafeteria roenbergensis]